jgi:ketosteroid isomerase-like protein
VIGRRVLLGRGAGLLGLGARNTTASTTASAAAPRINANENTMPTSANDKADLAELRALNARFIHNFVNNDVPSHDAITHERFLCISSNGARQEKAAYLRDWAHGFDPEVIPYWDTRDERIDVFGDVALVRATNKHVRRSNGSESTGMTSYTDTYLREGGRWRCVQAQLTAVSPKHHPGDHTIVSVYLRGRLQARA